MLRVGIVGLPNVGKSTLFSALTKQAAESANFPFTTIEPNVGIVPVPDARLEKLAQISKSERVVPTAIEFVDIAGLVRNAHQGEGLGNQFLANIREVDAIAHVVRFFEDRDVVHVDNTVDPTSDVQTIETELALADLAQVERQLTRSEKEARSGDKELARWVTVLKHLQEHLASGGQVRDMEFDEKEQELLQTLPLLTYKPCLYVANLDEAQIKELPASLQMFSQQNSPTLPLSIKIEQELVELPDEDRLTFLEEYGLEHTGLERLIQEAYQLLSLITYFTSGPQETRAWTVRQNSTAPVAAGKIHSDMQRGFIRAETVAYMDLAETGSYAAARAAGMVRDEGKEYKVKDGDVMLFKFSV